ncbi:hypothetical protein [Vibrio sp. LaRot3]|uniref:hypothetical protein n=1 Tax=Vibrio sp. LaRot3 TaxID=2998829 RepID=UPI0022CE062E|nr:hypothetical protein [Vibrio sp. LaRot3]MDA0149888.1 hypothetical protein [Vibrio sp. LaRot3]
MRNWTKHCRMLSILLTLWLACFSAHAAFNAPSTTTSFPLSLPSTLKVEAFTSDSLNSSSSHSELNSTSSVHSQETEQHSTKIHVEKRIPAKSLTPTLSTVLRNGSFAYERLNEAEPSYELVFDLDEVIDQVLVWRVYLALNHWHDWTLTPPTTLHRVSGWKESNILYRFISQADA